MQSKNEKKSECCNAKLVPCEDYPHRRECEECLARDPSTCQPQKEEKLDECETCCKGLVCYRCKRICYPSLAEFKLLEERVEALEEQIERILEN